MPFLKVTYSIVVNNEIQMRESRRGSESKLFEGGEISNQLFTAIFNAYILAILKHQPPATVSTPMAKVSKTGLIINS